MYLQKKISHIEGSYRLLRYNWNFPMFLKKKQDGIYLFSIYSIGELGKVNDYLMQ